MAAWCQRHPTVDMVKSPIDSKPKVSMAIGAGPRKFSRSVAKAIKAVVRNQKISSASVPETHAGGRGVTQHVNFDKRRGVYGGVIRQDGQSTLMLSAAKATKGVQRPDDAGPRHGRALRAMQWLANKFHRKDSWAFDAAKDVSAGRRSIPHHFLTRQVESAGGVIYKINGDGELLAHRPGQGGATWNRCGAPAPLQRDGKPAAPLQRQWSELARHADGNTYALLDGDRIVPLDATMPATLQIVLERPVRSFTALGDQRNTMLVLDVDQVLHTFERQGAGEQCRMVRVGDGVPLTLRDDSGAARAIAGKPVTATKILAEPEGRIFVMAGDRQLYRMGLPDDAERHAHPVLTKYSSSAQLVDLGLAHPNLASGLPKDTMRMHAAFSTPNGSVRNAYLATLAECPGRAEKGRAVFSTGYEFNSAIALTREDGADIQFDPPPGSRIVLNGRAGLELAVRNGGPGDSTLEQGRLYVKRPDTGWEPTGVTGLEKLKVNPLVQYKSWAMRTNAAGASLVELDTSVTQRYIAGAHAPQLAAPGGRTDVVARQLTDMDLGPYFNKQSALVDFAVIDGGPPPSPPLRMLYTVDTQSRVRAFDLVTKAAPKTLGKYTAIHGMGAISKIAVDRAGRVFAVAGAPGDGKLYKLATGGDRDGWVALPVNGTAAAPLTWRQHITDIESDELGELHVLVGHRPGATGGAAGRLAGPYRYDHQTGDIVAPDQRGALANAAEQGLAHYTLSRNLPAVHANLHAGIARFNTHAGANPRAHCAERAVKSIGNAAVDSAMTTWSHLRSVRAAPKVIGRAIDHKLHGHAQLDELYQEMNAAMQPLYHKSLPALPHFANNLAALDELESDDARTVLATFDALAVDMLNMVKSIGVRSGFYDARHEVDPAGRMKTRKLPALDPQHDLLNDVRAWLTPLLEACLCDPVLGLRDSPRKVVLASLRDRLQTMSVGTAENGRRRQYLYYPPVPIGANPRSVNDPHALLGARLAHDINSLARLGDHLGGEIHARSNRQAGAPTEKSMSLGEKIAHLKHAHYASAIIDYTDFGFQDFKPLEATCATLDYFSNALTKPTHKLYRNFKQSYGVQKPEDVPRKFAEMLLTNRQKEINVLESSHGVALDPLAWFGGALFANVGVERSRTHYLAMENVGNGIKTQPLAFEVGSAKTIAGNAAIGCGASDPFVHLFRAGVWAECMRAKTVTKGMMFLSPLQHVDAFTQLLAGRDAGGRRNFDLRAVLKLCVARESLRTSGSSWEATLHAYARFGQSAGARFGSAAVSSTPCVGIECRFQVGGDKERYDLQGHMVEHLGDGHTTVIVSTGRERHKYNSMSVSCYLGGTLRTWLSWPPDPHASHQFASGFFNQNFLGPTFSIANKAGFKTEERTVGQSIDTAIAGLAGIRKADLNDTLAAHLPAQAGAWTRRRDESADETGNETAPLDEAARQWHEAVADIQALFPEYAHEIAPQRGLVEDRADFVAGLATFIAAIGAWPAPDGIDAKEFGTRKDLAAMALTHMKLTVELALREVPEVCSMIREARIANAAGLTSAAYWEKLAESCGRPIDRRMLHSLIALQETDATLHAMLDNLKDAHCTRYKVRTEISPTAWNALRTQMAELDATGKPKNWTDAQLSAFEGNASNWRIATVSGLVGGANRGAISVGAVGFLRSWTATVHEATAGTVFFRYGLDEKKPIAYEMTDAHIGEQKTVRTMGAALGMRPARLPDSFAYDPTVAVPEFARKKE